MVVDQVPSQTYVATSNSQIQLYGSQPMSPVTPTTAITPPSATSSGTQSSGSQPFTDPLNLPNPSRQLRPPKIPLYVPAVLRPTERPSRPSSLTPPQSLSSSADTARSLEALNGVSQHWTRDRPANFVGPGRFIEDEWSYNLGDVNGPPTRDHWKPDSSAALCNAPECTRTFSLFERRHHCRRCGNIFCGAHAAHHAPLDQHARFHPEGYWSRACDRCWTEYGQWRQVRSTRSNSEISQEDGAGTPTTPTMGIGNPRAGGLRPSKAALQGREDGQKVGSFAGSVPRDWSWSTF